MQTAISGVYRQGQVILNESYTAEDETPVLVIFLSHNEEQRERPVLRDFFHLCGAWEDDRTPDQIIDNIYADIAWKNNSQ
jgi:hypothetical protein